MSAPTPTRALADALIGRGYLRQFHYNRWRIVGWHPENLYPDAVKNTAAGRRAEWRAAGLDPRRYSEPVWGEALMMLPAVPSDRELFDMPDANVRALRARLPLGDA